MVAGLKASMAWTEDYAGSLVGEVFFNTEALEGTAGPMCNVFIGQIKFNPASPTKQTSPNERQRGKHKRSKIIHGKHSSGNNTQ